MKPNASDVRARTRTGQLHFGVVRCGALFAIFSAICAGIVYSLVGGRGSAERLLILIVPRSARPSVTDVNPSICRGLSHRDRRSASAEPS
jgi:hypothetical protein